MEDLDFPLVEAREGLVKFYVPKADFQPRGPGSARLPVFYNPAMELNRDLAVAFLNALSPKHRIRRVCDPMAGCGVRGIRFAVEVEGVEWAALNDLNPRAAKLSMLNVRKAGVEGRVSVFNLDADEFLAKHSAPNRRFDYVDLDPYGSPMPYLDSCLKAVRAGGFLALTATDLPPLCGIYPKTCLRRYWAKPLRTEYCHEIAVRILIGAAARLASRLDLALKPLFTHASDHYVRVYFQVLKGAKRADKTLEELGFIYHCPSCLSRKPLKGFLSSKVECEVCGREMDYAGPLWLGELWDGETVEAMASIIPKLKLGQAWRAAGILEKILSELRVPAVTYYVVDRLAERFRVRPLSPKRLIEEVEARGFKASLTHFTPQGVRTNAPLTVLAEILRKS